MSQSLEIVSNQPGVHERLQEVVTKHLQQPFLKPISPHTQEVFDRLSRLVLSMNKPVVLDSCCGVGESTQRLAQRHPDCFVVGLDKSAHRLARHGGDPAVNYCLERVDLNDFWRLVADANWPIKAHYLLYPNPWPKSKHLQRRWHGAPVFPYLLKMGGVIELRSNWKIYLDEFQQALLLAGIDAAVSPFTIQEPLTPFERKYQQSGHQIWRLTANLG
jgi:tRNA (guanine-N7-)-methyltransferase